MGRVKAQVVPRLVPVHWWVQLGPRVSDFRALGVPQFVCQPNSGWGQGPGSLGAGICPLVGEAGPGAHAGPLVLQGMGFSELVLAYWWAHWYAGTGPGPSGGQG